MKYSSAERFRVLIVSTRSDQRIRHIMTRTAAITRVAERSLFYDVPLSQYLATPNPVITPCFRNHRGEPVPLVYVRGDVPEVLLRATGWCALSSGVLTSRSCRQPGSRERRGINECPDSLPTHPEHSAVTGTVGSG